MLNRFYDSPTAEPDLSCAESMEEPVIWAPMYATTIAPRLGALYFDDKKKLVLPGVWAGASVLISLTAFLVLTLAPIGRWMNQRRVSRSGATRFLAWLAATAAVAAVAVLGAAAFVTSETSDLALLFGLVPWAGYAAWLGLAAGLLGLLTLFAAFSARRRRRIPTGTMLGLILTGAAAIGLSSFMLAWGLAPF